MIAILTAVTVAIATVSAGYLAPPSAYPAPRAVPDANGFVDTPNLIATPQLAPDHVMLMESDRGWGPNPRSIVTVRRHGMYRREDGKVTFGSFTGRSTVGFDNMATGAFISATLDADGLPRSMTMFGRAYTGREPRITRRTDRTQVIAGERCTIWRNETLARPARRGFTEIAWDRCITSDNIVLGEWVVGYDDKPRMMRIATRLERRPVAEAEVRPDARYFDWRYWSALKADVAPQPRAFPLDRYEVVLSGYDGKDTRTQVARGFGDWTLGETFRNDERVSFFLASSHVSIRAGFYEDGRPEQLSVGVFQAPNPAYPGLPPLSRFKPSDSAVVLGERCDIRAGMANPHLSESTCRTRDGLTLISSITGPYAPATVLRATRIARGTTTAASVAIPAGVFDRKRWGW